MNQVSAFQKKKKGTEKFCVNGVCFFLMNFSLNYNS